MKRQLRTYLQSFKVKKEFAYTSFFDFLFVIITSVLFTLITYIINKQGNLITGGKTVEELKIHLLSAAPEQAAAFLHDMKLFLLYFFLFGLGFAIITLLLFALTRAKIWHYLTKTKFNKKKILKWILLIIITILSLILISIPFFLIKYFLLIFFQIYPHALAIAGQIVNFLFITLAATVFFLVCRNFTKEYKIWSSITKAFESIGSHFKKFLTIYIFANITSTLIVLIIMLLFYLIPVLQDYNLYISAAVFILFLNWLRLYLIKFVH